MQADIQTKLPSSIVRQFEERLLLLSQINQTRASYVSLLAGHDHNDGLSCWVRSELRRLEPVFDRHLSACLGLLHEAAELEG